MAITKTGRLKREVGIKKQYQSYFQKMRKSKKQPMTYYHWKKSGRTPTYFKGTEATRPEAHLRRKQRKTFGLPD